MECFGATKKGPRIAKRLRNMGGMRRLELLTSTVSMRRPAIDSKGVNRVTCALRVLALPQKTTSELPKDISRLGASSELFGLPTD